MRPDGTGQQRIGDASTAAICNEVALRDRFTLLGSPAPVATAAMVTQRVWLYDLASRRAVLLSPTASDANGRGDYVWWTTGDHETRAWRALDLRSLG
jgi:hypothetical protein